VNIFFLDPDLEKCAQSHVDKHVVKIITEANQCMSCAYHEGIAPYHHSYFNHPMVIWVRNSKTNFNWTLEYCLALCREYTYRYGKIHAGEAVANWYKHNPLSIPDLGFTDPPRCFGEFKDKIKLTDNIYADYRNYYLDAKCHLFSWKNRERPNWIGKPDNL
jgi:hypothetical protein